MDINCVCGMDIKGSICAGWSRRVCESFTRLITQFIMDQAEVVSLLKPEYWDVSIYKDSQKLFNYLISDQEVATDIRPIGLNVLER